MYELGAPASHGTTPVVSCAVLYVGYLYYVRETAANTLPIPQLRDVFGRISLIQRLLFHTPKSTDEHVLVSPVPRMPSYSELSGNNRICKSIDIQANAWTASYSSIRDPGHVVLPTYRPLALSTIVNKNRDHVGTTASLGYRQGPSFRIRHSLKSSDIITRARDNVESRDDGAPETNQTGCYWFASRCNAFLISPRLSQSVYLTIGL
ncbi:hypothetical protein F4779DRAFT_139555 [Xylariaceae sp. FL0662B]|nr:hypothetical protein F4779DRAFT_139555 [Xylariaceae sp. FL0662B]